MTTKILAYQGQPGAAPAVAFAATTDATIDAATVCNPTDVGAVLSAWIVPQGAAAGDATALYHELDVAAGASASLALLVNHAIPRGAEVHLSASAASTLTVTLSGRAA